MRCAALAFDNLRFPLRDIYKTLAHRWPETPTVKQEEEEEEKGQAAGGPRPRWLRRCRKVFGYSMKEHVTSDGHWDAYVIGVVLSTPHSCSLFFYERTARVRVACVATLTRPRSAVPLEPR